MTRMWSVLSSFTISSVENVMEQSMSSFTISSVENVIEQSTHDKDVICSV